MGALCSSDRSDKGPSKRSKRGSKKDKKDPKKRRKKKDTDRMDEKVLHSVGNAGGLVTDNWEITDPEDIDHMTGVQRKRLSIMGKKVGNMDYEEDDEDRARNRMKVEKIRENDIQYQKDSSKKTRKGKRKKKKKSTSSGECHYVAISKKGYVPYDHDKKNQDSVICVESLKMGPKHRKGAMHFFGVADGHGVVGHFVSQFVQKELPMEIEDRLQDVEGKLDDFIICDILRDSIIEVAEALEDSDIDHEYSGTTLVCSLIYDNMIYTANCGDSQGMIVTLNSRNKRGVIDINELHKPEDTGEKERIERYGGIVAKLPDLPFEDAGPFRVWNEEMTGPGLAMSRSLGDGAAHELGVSSVPTIDVRPLNAECKYIAWGSDGVFEFMTSDEVSKIILRKDTIKEMAQTVVNEAVKRWRRFDEVVDDISCVLLKLPEE